MLIQATTVTLLQKSNNNDLTTEDRIGKGMQWRTGQ